MSTPLLTTRLYTPPVCSELVSRPRLIERLNEGLHRRLTLVSAPAGFGKTTLVTEWLNSAERPFTWLSVDENDNDPARFTTYLSAALVQPPAPIRIDGHLELLYTERSMILQEIYSTCPRHNGHTFTPMVFLEVRADDRTQGPLAG